MSGFDFENLFIFDLANNHQGDVEHGKRIISEVGEVVNEFGFRATIKFQFRNLDTFIHPDFKDRMDIKLVKRFSSTKLEKKDFIALRDAVKEQGLITMSTPFDEASVDTLREMDIDIIKVASCSAADRPLLEKIAEAKRPVVVSTAGLSIRQIDQTVSLFRDRNVDFAIMHCVAIYPTPHDQLRLNQIDLLRERYPDITIGFSTHEDQDNLTPIRIAYAKGARIFERHVAIKTDKYDVNLYSSQPNQVQAWLEAYCETVESCGGENRPPATPEERLSLASLKRGIFANKDIKKGEKIARDSVFFAMPLQENQVTSEYWNQNIIADRDYKKNEALSADLANYKPSKEQLIYEIMLQVKGMLNEARISIGKGSEVQISHHYGIDRFREFGAVIVDCVNRTYCKKLIILLPRQKHPYHFHKKKEETFQLLRGDLEVEINGKRTAMVPGDTILIKPNDWHKFHTLGGAIFEEISTTHYNNDSFYEDESIQKLPREDRKTTIENWEAAVRPV